MENTEGFSWCKNSHRSLIPLFSKNISVLNIYLYELKLMVVCCPAGFAARLPVGWHRAGGVRIGGKEVAAGTRVERLKYPWKRLANRS